MEAVKGSQNFLRPSQSRPKFKKSELFETALVLLFSHKYNMADQEEKKLSNSCVVSCETPNAASDP